MALVGLAPSCCWGRAQWRVGRRLRRAQSATCYSDVSTPISRLSFTADRDRYALGLPDLVDHGSLRNNPGQKREWRREQASLPKQIMMLQRKASLRVIERLKAAEAAGVLASLSPGMLFTGGEGCGKSMALLHVVEWAKSAGWLVCYVPNARHWVKGHQWEPHPNPGRSGCMSQSMVQASLAYAFCESFALANHTLLGSIPLRHEFAMDHPGRETLALGPSGGHTLQDLLNIVPQLNTPSPDDPKGTVSASPHVIFVVEHLQRELVDQKSFPLLIAIDQYNFLFGRSGYRALPRDQHQKTQAVPAERLRMCQLLGQWGTEMPANGLMVGALCHGHPLCRDGLAMSKWAGQLTKYRVPRFSMAETWAMLEHWGKSGVMSRTVDETLFARAAAVTQNSPRELHRFAMRH
jgi:hypothetical protein